MARANKENARYLSLLFPQEHSYATLVADWWRELYTITKRGSILVWIPPRNDSLFLVLDPNEEGPQESRSFGVLRTKGIWAFLDLGLVPTLKTSVDRKFSSQKLSLKHIGDREVVCRRLALKVKPAR